MVWKQALPVGLGVALFKLTRYLKKSSGMDSLYFVVPFLYANYGIFIVEQKGLFEMGYPAHPYVLKHRMHCINKTCFSYPQIVKNEIEYLHSKLIENHRKVHGEDDEEEGPPLKFERVFTIGEVTSDYKRLL